MLESIRNERELTYSGCVNALQAYLMPGCCAHLSMKDSVHMGHNASTVTCGLSQACHSGRLFCRVKAIEFKVAFSQSERCSKVKDF